MILDTDAQLSIRSLQAYVVPADAVANFPK